MTRRILIWCVMIASLSVAVAVVRSLLADESGQRDPSSRELPLERDAVPIRVDVFEYGFNPSTVVIAAGQAVAFRNVGEEIHEIAAATAEGEQFFDAARRQGRAGITFPRPGRYPIYCKVHPAMEGEVRVRSHF